MRASVRRTPGKSLRRGESRFEHLAGEIERVGVEHLYAIELWARASDRPGRFSDAGLALDMLGAKGSDTDMQLDSPEDVADRLYEIAVAEEEKSGPVWWQARLYAVEADGSQSSTYRPCTFRTDDLGPSTGGGGGGEHLEETMLAQSRVMKDFARTTETALKQLTGMLDRFSAVMSPESVAAMATAETDRIRLHHEHKMEEEVMRILNERGAQWIAETAPGVAAAAAAEPTMNTLPERLTRIVVSLDEAVLAKVIEAMGEDLWAIVEAAARCATNIDFRSVLAEYQARFSAMEQPKRLALSKRVGEALPEDVRKAFFQVLIDGGIR